MSLPAPRTRAHANRAIPPVALGMELKRPMCCMAEAIAVDPKHQFVGSQSQDGTAART